MRGWILLLIAYFIGAVFPPSRIMSKLKSG